MPRKPKLGQHWLNDRSALDALVQAAAIGPKDTVLEIGPGQGALTGVLLQTGAKVVAVELDGRLARNLAKSFTGNNRLEVIPGDIRRFDVSRLPADYVVAANIPYYLTAPLIKQLITAANPPRRLALLVQKEVAERLAAGPGNMSVIAVAAQLFGRVSLGQTVPAAAFLPPPKVDSRIVIIERWDRPMVQAGNRPLLKLVKAGFASRRKTLANNLSAAGIIDKAEQLTIFPDLGLEPTIRAQELSLKQWEKLYDYIKKII